MTNGADSTGTGALPIRHPVIFWIGCLVALLVLDFCCTGIWTIQENEQGVVLRFGKMQRKVLPGLVFTLPWPLEEMWVVNTQETLKMPVGFRFSQGMDSSPFTQDESEWLTGDTNVIDVELMIHYRIADPEAYLFRIGPGDADFLIRKCAESVLTEVMGTMAVDSILTTGKNQIEERTLALSQIELERYGAGVKLTRASLQKIVPPAEVIYAFNDVSSAKAERDQEVQEADGYAREIIPDARALADKIEQEALEYESQVLSEAQGRAARFLSIYTEYREAPEITRKRLFLETVETVLAHPQKILINLNEDGKAELKIIQ